MILNLKIAGIVGGFSYYSLFENKVFNWFQYLRYVVKLYLFSVIYLCAAVIGRNLLILSYIFVQK